MRVRACVCSGYPENVCWNKRKGLKKQPRYRLLKRETNGNPIRDFHHLYCFIIVIIKVAVVVVQGGMK